MAGLSSANGISAQLIQTVPESVLDQIPGAAPPDGQTSNLINPPDKGPQIVAGASVIVGVAYLMVFLRIYAKTCLIRKASWDDLTLALGALCGTIFFAGVARANTRGPWGKHQWDVSASELLSKSNAILPSWLVESFASPSLGLVKLTLFLFQYSLFWPLKWFRYCVYSGATISTLFYLGMAIAQIINQTPTIHETWLESWLSPKILVENSLNRPVGIIGLIIDVYIFVIPLVAVYQRQMQKNQKLKLALMFSFGALGCVASILSIYYRSKSNGISDTTGTVCYAELTCLAEIFIGVMIACFPSVSKVLRDGHFPQSWKSMGSRVKSSFVQVHIVTFMDKARAEEPPSNRAVQQSARPAEGSDEIV